jgi:hypothetical protein
MYFWFVFNLLGVLPYDHEMVFGSGIEFLLMAYYLNVKLPTKQIILIDIPFNCPILNQNLSFHFYYIQLIQCIFYYE